MGAIDGKVFLLIRVRQKIKPCQIIPALNLTALNFNLMVSEGSMSVKLGMVPNHVMTRVQRGMH